MVVLAAQLSAEETAALQAASGLKLYNIKRQRRGRAYEAPRSEHHRERTNRQSCRDVPDGFNMCPRASCDLLIPAHRFLDTEVTCSSGHITDLREMELMEMLSPGGIALVGLTNTQQGRIAEQVVWDLHDLGPKLGLLTEWLSAKTHGSTFDMVTSRGFPVEIRSVSTRAVNHAFALSSGKKRRMDAEMKRREAHAQVGILVILNFVTMTADIYVRQMDRAIYFERPAQAFATGIPFANPHAEPDERGLCAASAVDEIPF